MKRTFLAVILATALCSCVYISQSVNAETEPLEATSSLMQRKLTHAKNILEGLVLEDFDKIKSGADELGLLSLEAAWLKGSSPEYVRHNSEFRWAVEGISEMADEENLEGATLKYAQVVVTCVECHKTVRGATQIARVR